MKAMSLAVISLHLFTHQSHNEREEGLDGNEKRSEIAVHVSSPLAVIFSLPIDS